VINSNFAWPLIGTILFFGTFIKSEYDEIAFKLNNQTPYLKISNNQQAEVSAFGPSDFVVFKGLVAVLDSDGSQISFFNKSGKYVKNIELPKGFYQRLIRDRNNNLYAFANNGLSTSIVKIGEQVVEQKQIEGSLDNIISQAFVDDYGIFFKQNKLINTALIDEINKTNLPSPSLLKEIKAQAYPQGQSIKRDCFVCKVANKVEASVNGVSYQIKYQTDKGESPSLMIGNKEVKLNHRFKNAGTRIEQVDNDGTAWIEQSIFLNRQTVKTYVFKITASGEIQSIYRLPTIHPDDYVQHQIAISDEGELWFMAGQPSGLFFSIIQSLSKEENIKFIQLKNNLAVSKLSNVESVLKKKKIL